MLEDFDIGACRKESPGIDGEESILDKGKTPGSYAGWIPDTMNRVHAGEQWKVGEAVKVEREVRKSRERR